MKNKEIVADMGIEIRDTNLLEDSSDKVQDISTGTTACIYDISLYLSVSGAGMNYSTL